MIKVKTKRLVLCADDFGMNPAIDAGILHLAALNRLTATSCLVDGPSFQTTAPQLKTSGLQCGLHLNFTESLGMPGLYLPISLLIRRAYLRQLDRVQVHRQIAHQLDRFQAVMGRDPDFVDGHQHVHQLPQIRQALLVELSRRFPTASVGAPRPWLRTTRPGSLAGIPLLFRAKARTIQALGSRDLARLAGSLGFTVNPGFLGVYDFRGGHQAYHRLLNTWLRRARDGDVLMCHPANRACDGDALGPQRLAEFNVLASRQMGQWLTDYGITV